MRDNGGTYEARAGTLNDSSAWTNPAWYTISDEWTAVEIEWQAANSVANNDGYLKLWVDDTLKETIADVDNDSHNVDIVTLGARAIESGTTGATNTLYIDDFESRRLSYIGTLPSPYTPPQPPTPAAWEYNTYDYDDPAQPGKPHAVKSVDRPGSDSTTLSYDANGNMTCHVEVVAAGTTTLPILTS